MPDTTISRAVIAAPREVAWTCWPAVEHPWHTVLLVVGVVAAGLVAGFGVGSITCGLLAAGLMSVSTANYLLPIRYTLSDDGVTVRGLGTPNLIKWSRIDAARLREDHAVLLVTPDGGVAAREFTLRYPPSAAEASDPLRQRLLDAGAPLV